MEPTVTEPMVDTEPMVATEPMVVTEPTVVPDSCGLSCEEGYFSVGTTLGQTCFDIDECRQTFLNNCPENSSCINTKGSYTCTCQDGFGRNDFNECSNNDECDEGSHSCESDSGAICIDTVGSYECTCPSNMQGTGYSGFPCHNSVSCEELGVEINMPSKSRFTFHTEGQKAIAYRIKLPQVPETKAYTGFFAFSSQYCGYDFIKHLSDGIIM